MLRILHCIAGLSKSSGGPSVVIPALCGAIAEHGHDVTIASLQPRPGDELAQVPDSVELVLHRPTPLLPRRIAASRALKRWLADHVSSYDIVHVHGVWSLTSTVAAQVARKLGVPFVVTPHGMLHEYCLRKSARKKTMYWSFVQRSAFQRAAGVHFLNKAEERGSAWLHGLATPRFTIPNGVDLGSMGTPVPGSFRARHPVLEDRRFMLFFGRLHWIKGLELQLGALAQLAEEFPDLMWMLMGPDAGEWSKIEAMSEDMGVRDRVLWVGMMSGPERFNALADADVILQTSHHECHSMAINEALAIGRPLVITESCNFQEVADNGVGFVVPGHAADVADAVRSILDDQNLAARMGAAGRAYAEEHLQWDKVAGQMIQVYEWLLGREPPPECVVT